ncbi:MAG: amidohydrolase/deacetylase family metallohydrolase [Pseudomonadota bacterium]
MALHLTNFQPLSLGSKPDMIAIDDDGTIAPGAIKGAQTIDCEGCYLSPGWCDLHVHIWHGGTNISVRAHQAGRATGVTAMADAGSAGEANFIGLREYVIDPSEETIRAFLNIGSIGLVACNRVSELIDMRSINIDKTLATIENHRDVICGVKVRASAVILGGWGMTPVKIAKHGARVANLPLMIHVGEPPPLLDEILDILEPGDIITHCFHGKTAGAITDTAALFERVRQHAQSGVVLDIGHGVASFNFEVARHALGEGLFPDTISTDLHLRNIDGPVYDMALTLSKFLALGMPLDAVITAVTRRPRAILGLDSGVAAGGRADFTVFSLDDANEQVLDSQANTLTLDHVLAPRLTIMGTSVCPAERRKPQKTI